MWMILLWTVGSGRVTNRGSTKLFQVTNGSLLRIEFGMLPRAGIGLGALEPQQKCPICFGFASIMLSLQILCVTGVTLWLLRVVLDALTLMRVFYTALGTALIPRRFGLL